MNSKSTQSISKIRLWVGNGLAALITLALLGSGISKLAHIPKIVAGLTHAGLPDAAILPIGILELSCLALYLIPRTSILGTFLLTGYLGGAIVTHIIARESLAPPLLIGIWMFASAYLRRPELQKLVPLRKIDHESRAYENTQQATTKHWRHGRAGQHTKGMAHAASHKDSHDCRSS